VSAISGLYYVNDSGVYSEHSVDVKVEIKKQGDAIWTNISKEYYDAIFVTDGEVARWSRGYWQADYSYSGNEAGGGDAGPSGVSSGACDGDANCG
jgi:hypothetical protein